jgi:hypothetical protein
MGTSSKVQHKSPRTKNDTYVGLLSISLLALVTCCALLYLDYAQYGAQKPTAVPASLSR